MKHLKDMNEMNQGINWKEIESKWNDYYEDTFGEADYDDEYEKLKSFVTGADVDWDSIESDYFDWIESTNNEAGYLQENCFETLTKL